MLCTVWEYFSGEVEIRHGKNLINAAIAAGVEHFVYSTLDRTNDPIVDHWVSKATVDDFVFDPCGYSMNGLEGSAFSTIHVTPQQDCSYASLELYGYTADQLDPTAVAEKVSFGATSTENVIWHSNCVLSHPPAKESVH